MENLRHPPNLERAVGNESPALATPKQALDADLAYRHDGGDPQMDPTNAVEMVRHAPTAARSEVDNPEVNYAAAAEILLALEATFPPGA